MRLIRSVTFMTAFEGLHKARFALLTVPKSGRQFFETESRISDPIDSSHSIRKYRRWFSWRSSTGGAVRASGGARLEWSRERDPVGPTPTVADFDSSSQKSHRESHSPGFPDAECWLSNS